MQPPAGGDDHGIDGHDPTDSHWYDRYRNRCRRARYEYLRDIDDRNDLSDDRNDLDDEHALIAGCEF